MKKTSILNMAAKRPDTMADMMKWVQNRQLNALFPFMVLFSAHILSFYEWKVVYQWLGDNFDVHCVAIGKLTENIYLKRYNFRVFSFAR